MRAQVRLEEVCTFYIALLVFCVKAFVHLDNLSLDFCSCLQQQHLSSLEEKLRAVRQSRDESQNHCTQQKQTIAELQARVGQQSVEMDTLRRRIEELQQVLVQTMRCTPGVLNREARAHEGAPADF